MSCPTPEQLATLSLGLTDDKRLVEHAEACATCAQVRASQADAIDRLSAVHRQVTALHVASRAQLLERLPANINRRPPSRWRRWAVAALAAAAVLLLAFVALAPNRLSAMDRIATAVHEVATLSCRIASTTDYPPTDDKPSRTHHDERFIDWRAPTNPREFGDLRATTTIASVHHLSTGDAPPKPLVDLIEIHPSGQPGVLIDFLGRRFHRVPPLVASDLNSTPPLLWLQAVRDQAGQIVRDLGDRQIHGRRARGYEMSFADCPEFNDYGPVEVWLDPETDLPVEFRFHHATTAGQSFTNVWSVSDIEWNRDLDPKLFDTTPPAGFVEAKLPANGSTKSTHSPHSGKGAQN